MMAGAKRGPKPIDRSQALPLIYAEVAAGRALDRVLNDDAGMPSARTFWRWHMEDKEIRHNLACARENGVERLMDECVGIADTPQEGVRTTTGEDGEVKEVREDMLGHRKLRIETRFKYAQMIAPRKYGPRVDVTSGGDKLDVHDATAVAVRAAALVRQALERNDEPE
jgi:hypothetical protein